MSWLLNDVLLETVTGGNEGGGGGMLEVSVVADFKVLYQELPGDLVGKH
jgi:hypothetical protein